MTQANLTYQPTHTIVFWDLEHIFALFWTFKSVPFASSFANFCVFYLLKCSLKKNHEWSAYFPTKPSLVDWSPICSLHRSRLCPPGWLLGRGGGRLCCRWFGVWVSCLRRQSLSGPLPGELAIIAAMFGVESGLGASPRHILDCSAVFYCIIKCTISTWK